MKSFEDINILVKAQLFCLKNLSFGKSFYLKKNYVFESKNMFLKENIKTFFLKKKIFFSEKLLFLKKKKN